MTLGATVVDELLEASVVGSFSKIGYEVRRRVSRWAPAPPLTGQDVLITGATSGIGHACALALARGGANLHFVARDEDRARRARDEFLAVSLSGLVDYVIADVADLSAIRDVAAWILERAPALHVLIHNAGAITKRPTRSRDGYELTVAAQLLGPFLLSELLLASLGRAAPGRVLTVSSGGMYTQRFDLDSLGRLEHYDGVRTYARVKRAQVVLNHEWARRVEATDVEFFVVHPGWVDTPGVRASLPGFSRLMGPLFALSRPGGRHHGLARGQGRPPWRHRAEWRSLVRPPAP